MKNSQKAKGFSLVEVLVVFAIMGIMGLAISTLTVTQMQAAKVINQKLEMNDLKQAIQAAMLNPGTCTCLLNPLMNVPEAANLSFNANLINLTATPPIFGVMSLNSINSACDLLSGAPILPIIRKGENLPGSQTGLRVLDIRVANIRPSNPITKEFRANFRVDFDPTTTVGSKMPVNADIVFKASGTAGIVTIGTCGAGALPGTITEQSVCENTLGFKYDPLKTPPCSLGGTAARNLCLGFKGTIDPSGTLCQLNLSIPGSTLPAFKCNVPLDPVVSHFNQVLYALMSLSQSPEFARAQLFKSRVEFLFADLTKANTRHKILELVGVDSTSNAAVVDFLRTRNFSDSDLTPKLMESLDLERWQAEVLLTSVAMQMAGNLN